MCLHAQRQLQQKVHLGGTQIVKGEQIAVRERRRMRKGRKKGSFGAVDDVEMAHGVNILSSSDLGPSVQGVARAEVGQNLG